MSSVQLILIFISLTKITGITPINASQASKEARMLPCGKPQSRVVQTLDYYNQTIDTIQFIMPTHIVITKCECSGACLGTKEATCQSNETAVKEFEIQSKLLGSPIVEKVIIRVQIDRSCKCKKKDVEQIK